MIKQNKGITLISLVITIIILLILAGISISILGGENGLFARAKQAKKNTLDAQNAENIILADYENAIDEIINGTSQSTIIGKVEFEISNIENDNVTVKISPTVSDENYILGYEIIVIKVSDTNTVINKMSESKEVIIDGLEAATEYEIYVVAYDKSNNERYSEKKKINTLLSISIENVTTSSIEINVKKPENMNGNIQYCYSFDGENYTDWCDENFYTFTGIYGDVSGVKCNLYVKTKDEIGNQIVTSIEESTNQNSNYYVNTANTELLAVSGRTFYKDNPIPAIAGIGYIGGYKGLFLVSTTEDAVTYYTNYDSTRFGSLGTIMYNGVEFYYSKWEYWMPNTSSYTSNLKLINSTSSSNPEEVAKKLLDVYYQ